MDERAVVASEVWSALDADGKLVLVRVRADVTVEVVDLRTRVLRWASNIPDLLHGDEAVWIRSIRLRPDGSVAFAIAKPTSSEVYQRIIESLVRELEDLDHVSVTLDKRDVPMLYRTDVKKFATLIHASPQLSDTARSRPPGPSVRERFVPRIGWDDLGPGVKDTVIAHALRWVQLPAGRLYMMYEDSAFEVQADDVPRLIDDLVSDGLNSNLYVVHEDYPRRARVVALTASAQLMYEDARFDEFDSAPEALRVASEVLLGLAPSTHPAFQSVEYTPPCPFFGS